jgi:hypothetical protein
MNDNIMSNPEDLLDIIRDMDAIAIAPAAPLPTPAPTTAPLPTPASASVPATAPVIADALPTSADALPEDAVDVDMDEYMARFEKIQSQSEHGKQMIDQLMKVKHSAGPLVGMLIDCIHNLSSQNEEMYSLLVDMNNLFGK